MHNIVPDIAHRMQKVHKRFTVNFQSQFLPCFGFLKKTTIAAEGQVIGATNFLVPIRSIVQFLNSKLASN